MKDIDWDREGCTILFFQLLLKVNDLPDVVKVVEPGLYVLQVLAGVVGAQLSLGRHLDAADADADAADAALTLTVDCRT